MDHLTYLEAKIMHLLKPNERTPEELAVLAYRKERTKEKSLARPDTVMIGVLSQPGDVFMVLGSSSLTPDNYKEKFDYWYRRNSTPSFNIEAVYLNGESLL